MKYRNAIKELAGYKRIVVTGCQRSGTTIAGKIIANDLGYKYVDEFEIGINDVVSFCKTLIEERVVIQCPALTHIMPKLDWEETAIVVIDRPIEEIIISEERVDLKTGRECEIYGYNDPKFLCVYKKLFLKKSEIKLPFFSIDYYSFKDHEMWRENRKDYTLKQTS